MHDNEFEIEMKPGRDSHRLAAKGAGSLVGQVLKASRRAGASPLAARQGRSGGTGRLGRGRDVALRAGRKLSDRRVVIKARIVRHSGNRFGSAPISRHLGYLQREGVTRDQQRGELFDADHDHADGEGFASRCRDDRHHFRFIVSPEDAVELADLRTFTRELLGDMASDMHTPLDWVAAEHWNTDNPHVHILVRGRTLAGEDLVIDREYMRHGLRYRAEDRATVELGLRSELDLHAAARREISSERWTGLDGELAQMQEREGVIDLRFSSNEDRRHQSNLRGRAAALERLGLALEIEPGRWLLGDDAEHTLRSLELRGDIIKSMHNSMKDRWPVDLARLELHHQPPDHAITGQLVHHAPHHGLSGGTDILIDGLDGQRHHLHLPASGEAEDLGIGSLVRVEPLQEADGRPGLTIVSTMTLDQQVTAHGPTWLDQQLVASEPEPLGNGFGQEVRRALAQRTAQLMALGLGSWQNGEIVLPQELLGELRQKELAETSETISRTTGLVPLPNRVGDHVAGTCREQIRLNCGQFAMIDNGMGFQLVPWEPALDKRLGQSVSGIVDDHGGIEWSFDRARTLGL